MAKEDKSNLNILLIRKQFLCATSSHKIDFNGEIDIEQQREILDVTINDSLVKKYPIKHVYQQAFIRQLIKKLETDGQEISDELYEALCNFLACNDSSSTHFRHFLMRNSSREIDRVIIEESKSIVSEGTTGLCSWQAAEALAEWCLFHKNEIDNKSVLELGSGIGLAGLTILSTCFPKKYTFTDCHPSVLKLLQKNLALNLSLQNKVGFDVEVDVINFEWELINQFTKSDWTSSDIILAADVVYDTSIFHSLITAFKVLLNKTNNYAIIAITVRNESTVSDFITQLGMNGLMYEDDSIPNYSIFFPPDDVPIRILKVYK